MGILSKYGTDIKQLNTLVTKEDIELEINDLLSDIEYIERTYNTALVGDRSNINRARRDCLGLTRGDCAYFFATWKNGIFSRYSPK